MNMLKRVSFYLLLFFSTFLSAQSSVFDIARSGKVEEMIKAEKEKPEIINDIDKNGFSPLILACYKQNNSVATYLLNRVKNIDYNSPNGTALMASVVKGNVEMVEKLIKHKADVNAADKMGNPALYYAIMFKNYEILKMLIAANANKKILNKEGNSMIFYAINSNDIEIKKIFEIED